MVHGSKHLPRRGYRLITYDARGHGESEPVDRYDYEVLGHDLDMVMSGATEAGAVLGGHSMGSHTVARRAILDPQGVKALVLIGPVFTGEVDDDRALGPPRRCPGRGWPGSLRRKWWPRTVQSDEKSAIATVERMARARPELHEHSEAVAQALRQMPRSKPFESIWIS